jgi:uncharacterized protein CbrC (UPF0167 family)
MRYYCTFCNENPNRKKKIAKIQAFYDAMHKRKGNRKNDWTNFDWSLIEFEKLSLHKKRQRLFKESNYSCSECGYNKTRDDGGLILEIDHIDGDHKKNKDFLKLKS